MSDLTDLYERLALYIAAEKKILEGNQSWKSPDGVEYNRAGLGQVRDEIRRIRGEIQVLENNGSYGSQQVVFGGRR